LCIKYTCQTDKAYDLVKSVLFKNRTKSSVIRNKDRKLLINEKKIDRKNTWKNFTMKNVLITEKFHYIKQESEVEIDSKEPSIIRSEFDNALEQLKNKEAAGSDLMKSELLKNIDKGVKKILYNKIQNFYMTGCIYSGYTGYIPSDFTIR
jgi:hypothetical protein